MDFFIVGTSRSGSTMVRQMLSDHPDAVVLNESHWVPWLAHFFGPGRASTSRMLAVVERTYWDSGKPVIEVNAELAGNEWTDVRGAVRDELGSHATVAQLHDTLVRVLFGAGERTLTGDKTPDYGFYMNALRGIWPDARFIHVVRDGLATAASMSRHRGVRLQVAAGFDNWCPLAFDRLYERYEDRPSSMPEFVGTWRRRIDRIRSEAADLPPDTYLEISYRDILAAPSDALALLARFLGLEPDREWIESASRIPRTPTRPVDSGVLVELTNTDLIRLNELGDGSHLSLPVDLPVDDARVWVSRGNELLQVGDHEHALHMGVSVAATAVARGSGDLTDSLVDLLTSAGRALGLDVTRLCDSLAPRA